MISLPFQYNLNLGVDRYEIDNDALFVRSVLHRWLRSDLSPDGVLRTRLPRPLLNGWFPGVDKHDRTLHVLNIQPVFPVNVRSVNLINRFIVPIMYQPIGKDDAEFGLGDIQYTLFFAPAAAGRVIWGIGPALSVPTASDDALGTGKWSAGPSAVVLTMPGRWVLGALVSNQWSFAGDDDRPDVNSMMIQPFVNYNFDKGWYFSFSPVITANHEAEDGQKWTVPLGGGFGRVFKAGKQPLNASISAYYNAEKPDGAADWTIGAQVKFMFPMKK